MEPCGAPQVTVAGFERVLFKETYWVLMEKYDSNHDIHFRYIYNISIYLTEFYDQQDQMLFLNRPLHNQ